MALTSLELAEFNLLSELGALLRRYNANIVYTIDDDGIHLQIGGEILSHGHFDADDMTARVIDLSKKTRTD